MCCEEAHNALAIELGAERGGGMDCGSAWVGDFRKRLGTALVAALVIGFINATIGVLLKIITFPLTLLTLGLVLVGH